MYIEMKVSGFTLDSIAQMPLVLLKDANEAHALPIWINTMDAVSIAAELISRDMSAESGCSDLLTKLLANEAEDR
jgi:bifunctional DNase/RNase